jgi:hypothetical protein
MFLTPHLTFLRHLLTSQTAGIRESSVLSLGFMGKSVKFVLRKLS